MRGFIAAHTGDRDTALGVIRQIEESGIGTGGLYEIGLIYYALGDLDSYFDHMNRAMELHVINWSYPMNSPLFANARADPRRDALLEKMRAMNWPRKSDILHPFQP